MRVFLRDVTSSIFLKKRSRSIFTIKKFTAAGRFLRFKSSELEEGGQDLFQGLTALQELGLENNQITALPQGLFQGLTALQKLWLDNNLITVLPQSLFQGLTALLSPPDLSGNPV
ncbi:MAG: leucine-rich repeat domain-containing protein [Chlamydiia bacterium]|nr:leucine-rich repeat domain-containing protein [Chlamydiia bacterium]